MGRIVAVAVLVMAVVGAVVLASLAGSALTPAASQPEDTAKAGPSTNCLKPARTTAGARRVFGATPTPTGTVTAPTPTSTGTVIPPTPTADSTSVQVVSLSATRTSKQTVVVRWRTASEARVLGYNIYCGPSTNRVIRNTRLIRGRGSTAAQRYSFQDRVAARVRRAGPYWLQIVDLNGKRRWYGSTMAR